MSEFYSGPWTILPDGATLESHPRLGMGEIRVHRTGLLILRCPQCRALQFAETTVKVREPVTLAGTIRCGSGQCTKCGITFCIVNGHSATVRPPAPAKIKIPERLARAGVRPPPHLPAPPED